MIHVDAIYTNHLNKFKYFDIIEISSIRTYNVTIGKNFYLNILDTYN